MDPVPSGSERAVSAERKSDSTDDRSRPSHPAHAAHQQPRHGQAVGPAMPVEPDCPLSPLHYLCCVECVGRSIAADRSQMLVYPLFLRSGALNALEKRTAHWFGTGNKQRSYEHAPKRKKNTGSRPVPLCALLCALRSPLSLLPTAYRLRRTEDADGWMCG